jgi:hypothetical protein
MPIYKMSIPLFSQLIVLSSLLLLSSSQQYCGGNCPSWDCPDCPCGSTTKYVDINYWCSQYSWNQACCRCIATHESGGNAHAMNFNAWDNSYDCGLLQVNSQNWPYCGIFAWNACDLNLMLQCAITVYKWGGNTWMYWSTAAMCGCSNSN